MEAPASGNLKLHWAIKQSLVLNNQGLTGSGGLGRGSIHAYKGVALVLYVGFRVHVCRGLGWRSGGGVRGVFHACEGWGVVRGGDFSPNGLLAPVGLLLLW